MIKKIKPYRKNTERGLFQCMLGYVLFPGSSQGFDLFLKYPLEISDQI